METTTAYDVAAELRSRLRGLGDLKLHKLLYYVQGWHLAWYEKPAFDEEIEAWDMGPVVAELWRSETHGHELPAAKPLVSTHITTVERVIGRYGRMTGVHLANLTHEEQPWSRAYETSRSSEITCESMRAFFASQPTDQGWFWSPEWLAGEREADADIRSGGTTTFDSAEDFIRSI